MSISSYTTKAGKTRYRVKVRHVIDGVSREVWVGTFDRKKEAQRAEAEALLALSAGEPVKKVQSTSLGSLADEYLKSALVGERSLEIYRTHVRRIKEHFGAHRPVQSLTKADVRAFVAELSRTKAPSTVKGTLTTLKAILRRAVDDGRLKVDPSDRVRAPRIPRTGVRVLTPREHRALVAAVPEAYRSLILVWPHIGLRRGEIFGLTWDRVDLKARTITVDRQHIEGSGLCRPKTEGSSRTVLLSEVAVRELRRWKLACPASSEGIVFPSPRGRFLGRNFLRRVLAPALEAAGIEGFSAHDFRHTFATWALSAGAPVKYVQAQMGHKNASTTLDIYGHLIPNDEDTILRRLDAWHESQEREAV